MWQQHNPLSFTFPLIWKGKLQWSHEWCYFPLLQKLARCTLSVLSSNALKGLFILLRHQSVSLPFFIHYVRSNVLTFTLYSIWYCSSHLFIRAVNTIWQYYVWIRFFFSLHVHVLKWSRNSMASSKEWLERVSLVKVKFLNMASKNFQIKFQIQLSVIGRGRNTLLDLHNSS